MIQHRQLFAQPVLLSFFGTYRHDAVCLFLFLSLYDGNTRHQPVFYITFKKEEVGYAVLSTRKDCYFAWRSRGRLAERLLIERGGMNVFDFEEIELVF
ncbi:hypothetical protein B14911_15312 [Bacillus sp. NRRL B-14911]|nr:hypothetical protein B14911_15312 [Bacillus sp. NRRL B-14911]